MIEQSKYSIHPLLEQRWSPCAFAAKTVANEKLHRIFEAARWAPSSVNEQPWRFIVGEKGSDTYTGIYNSVDDGNRLWADLAPVLAVALAKKHFTKKEISNFYSLYDTGQAVAHLTFQAAHEGLHVHQMGGFSPDKLINYFNIPDEFSIATVIAIGYLGNPDRLKGRREERVFANRKRRDLSDTVFTETFGKSYF